MEQFLTLLRLKKSLAPAPVKCTLLLPLHKQAKVSVSGSPEG